MDREREIPDRGIYRINTQKDTGDGDMDQRRDRHREVSYV